MNSPAIANHTNKFYLCNNAFNNKIQNKILIKQY
jgi:hypothetical protein